MPSPGLEPEACGNKGQSANRLATRPPNDEEEENITVFHKHIHKLLSLKSPAFKPTSVGCDQRDVPSPLTKRSNEASSEVPRNTPTAIGISLCRQPSVSSAAEGEKKAPEGWLREAAQTIRAVGEEDTGSGVDQAFDRCDLP
ncbi:hypothetical protein CEXT_57591 [Caerostris extrusa]|uniref:Uncharacterized protein n=1 Tax=Caerostris extrusa TaxID=172846 RepID=A0AAV4TSV6_CAEEX|nr:hypothetical protein CEXT_57591 [Caerostris extrusa]